MDNHIEETLKEGMKRRTESARLSEDMLASAASRYSGLHAKSGRRKVVLRIALAAAAIVVVAAGTVAAIPSARAAAEAFLGFDSRSADTELGYLPDQSHWSKTYSITIRRQPSMKDNAALAQALYQNGAEFVQYKLTSDTGKPLPSGATVEIANHENVVLQTGISGALITTNEDAANESFGTHPYTVTTWPKSGSYEGGAGDVDYKVDYTCDTQTATKKSGTWTYSRIPETRNADGSSSSGRSHAVRVSSGTWSYDIATGKMAYDVTAGTNPFTSGLATPLEKNPMFAQFIPPKTIPYSDARSLTWVTNGIRVEILSNLSKDELVKVGAGFSIGREFPEVNATTSTSLPSGTSAAIDSVAKRVADSLVTIIPSGSKSVVQCGVVYSADGLILTEGPDDSASFKVELADGETVTAKLVGEDKTTHVELLRVEKSGLSPVKLASAQPKAGEWVAAVVKTGSSLTSTPARVLDSPRYPVPTHKSFLSDLVAVTPAKQLVGEPQLFDMRGDYVGLVTAGGAQSVGNAIVDTWDFLPADKVAAAVAKLLSGS